MAQVSYTGEALADLDRLYEFLAARDAREAAAALSAICDAVEVLRRHPLIGRPAENGLSELVVSRGKTGYVALYQYFAALDAVLVLAVRHQREAGYRD